MTEFNDTPAMLDCLRRIVAQEPWDVDDLAAWANEFLAVYEDAYGDRDRERIWQEEKRQLQERLAVLKPQVSAYHHDPSLPDLPSKPAGQLHGIGFIYDEDRDDRVLVAIDKLRHHPDVVALAEHEGGLKIYSRLPVRLDCGNSINVGGDEWVIESFVPYQGRWRELTREFERACVYHVLRNKAEIIEPATAWQVGYLKAGAANQGRSSGIDWQSQDQVGSRQLNRQECPLGYLK